MTNQRNPPRLKVSEKFIALEVVRVIDLSEHNV